MAVGPWRRWTALFHRKESTEPQCFRAEEQQPMTCPGQPELSGGPQEAQPARPVPCSLGSVGPHSVTVAPPWHSGLHSVTMAPDPMRFWTVSNGLLACAVSQGLHEGPGASNTEHELSPWCAPCLLLGFVSHHTGTPAAGSHVGVFLQSFCLSVSLLFISF